MRSKACAKFLNPRSRLTQAVVRRARPGRLARVVALVPAAPNARTPFIMAWDGAALLSTLTLASAMRDEEASTNYDVKHKNQTETTTLS